MNEMDNLKNAWNTIVQSHSGRVYSYNELQQMVRKRSRNELIKFRRKILLEWAIAICLSAIMVLFIWSINPADTKYALIFMGLILTISFFPYIKIIRLKFTNHYDLKSYLQEFIMRFNLLIRQYIRMATILLPVAGFGGFLLGFHASANPNEWLNFFNIQNLLITAGCVSLISIVGHWLQHKYFKWIYGKNIQRLQDCLDDLEGVEDIELSE